jgi:hypothetical protein
VTSVALVIGNRDNTLATGIGVITGSAAVCRIPYTTADTIKNGTLWRCVVTVADSDGTDIDHQTPINGEIRRYDGKDASWNST